MEAIDAAIATSPVSKYEIKSVSKVPITRQLIALTMLRTGRSDCWSSVKPFFDASLFKINRSTIIGSQI